MRLLFIRHGDPDYEHDTLTEKGHREAALLAERAGALELGDCYVSPLGRAQATAAYSMKKLGRTAKTLGWLQEFPAKVDLNRLPGMAAGISRKGRPEPAASVSACLPECEDKRRKICTSRCMGYCAFLLGGIQRLYGSGAVARMRYLPKYGHC